MKKKKKNKNKKQKQRKGVVSQQERTAKEKN
jgi:hypothetical protein